MKLNLLAKNCTLISLASWLREKDVVVVLWFIWHVCNESTNTIFQIKWTHIFNPFTF